MVDYLSEIVEGVRTNMDAAILGAVLGCSIVAGWYSRAR